MAATSKAAPASDIGRPQVDGPAWPRGRRPGAPPHRVAGLRGSRARAQRPRRAGRLGRRRYSFDLAHKANHQYTFPATALAHPRRANTLTGLTANSSNELMNPAPGQALTYNADGYLVSDSVRTYSYDSDGDGHILSVTQAGSTIAGYKFDVFGRRIAKTVGGVTTQYLLDDQGHEIGEYDGSGTLLRYLVYDPFQTAPVVALDPMGNPSYIEVDRTGSVVATSSGAALANTYAYLPYGDTPSGTLSGTAFGYGGYRFDAETGTYHTATRQYDPRLGRFLQSDPIGHAGDKNIYAYAGGDPINGADPSGLDDMSGSFDSGSLTGSATVTPGSNANQPGLTPQDGAFGQPYGGFSYGGGDGYFINHGRTGSGSHGNPGGSPYPPGTMIHRSGSMGGGASPGGPGPAPPPVLPTLAPFNVSSIQLPRITEPGYTGAPDLPLGGGGFGILLGIGTLPFGGEGYVAEELSGPALARPLGLAGESAVRDAFLIGPAPGARSSAGRTASCWSPARPAAARPTHPSRKRAPVAVRYRSVS